MLRTETEMSQQAQQHHLTTTLRKALDDLGLAQIEVEVDGDLITYLRGQLANEDQHPQVIEAAYAAGAVQIVDGLMWPGFVNEAHIDRPHAVGIRRDHAHGHATEPGVAILQGARLEGRLFSTDTYSHPRTGNQID